jgi:ATP-binding cassette subfamily B protein
MNNARKTLSFYWRHIRRFPRYAIGAAVLLPINTLVNSYIPPLVLANVLNRLSRHEYSAHHVWASFGNDLILYAVLSVIGGTVLWRVFDMFYWRLGGSMERSIAQQVFSHLINQSADFHANQFAGSLVSQTNKLTSSYDRIADTTLFQVAPLLIGLVFVCSVMASRSPIYALLLLAISIIYIISAFFVTATVRRLSAEQASAESKQTGVLADAIGNVMAIKSFAREDSENERFARATDTTYGKLLTVMHAFQKQQLYFSSVTGVLSTFSLLVAVISVVSLHANLATAFLIFNYTSSIVSQLFSFSNNSLRNYNRAFGDASDMITILGMQPEIQDPEEPEAATMTRGAIAFENVVFAHTGSEEAIFDAFNLSIKHGEKIGLVGHSGAGKTTFTRLLLRFSDITSGAITIDGQNIAHVTQEALHDAIAYVPQEPLLFHRSIRENIAYGKPNASKKAVLLAAQRAHADEFIHQLAAGYETLVGERGVKLSGGQRQRIAIARAMLKDAPIILLDEATSALDSESEALIQDALWKLMEGRTAIVIAHRLSTIQRMDRIIVLDQGAIAEQGSHKELLKRNGIYAKLWARQSGGFMED